MATKNSNKEINLKPINLTDIVSNTAQSRGMGALPVLQQMGYGLFEQLPEHDDKQPIWSLLLSDKPDERSLGCSLIMENEGHIVDKAASLEQNDQLQNIIVAPAPGKTEKYDVVGGMLRCIAMAYNHAQDKNAPTTVLAKVVTKPEKELIFLSLEENIQRKSASPIDMALTFKRIKDEFKEKPADIGKRVGLTGQSIRDYLRLLDPKLADKRMDIHSGKLTIDKAKKLLAKREAGDKDDDGESELEKGKRARMHSVKKLTTAYQSKKKPEWMDQKEWEMFIKEDVRRWLSFCLKLKFKEFTGEVKSEEPEEEAEEPKVKPFKISIPIKKAQRLLVALGKDQATEWSADVIKEKLESIVNLVEDGQVIEDEGLQALADKLISNYARGLEITIKTA